MTHIGTIARACKIGKKGHEAYEWCSCPDCGKERWVVITKRRPANTVPCKKCGSARTKGKYLGPKSHAWGGGRRDSDGYIMVYVDDSDPLACMRVCGKYIAEHRLVIARAIGRPLTRRDHVHHKNGNRADNRIENLQLTTAGEHSKDHSRGYSHGFEQGYRDGLLAAKEKTDGEV